MTRSLASLSEAIAAIRFALIEEADRQPSEQLRYGRPHDTARTRHHAKYTPTGVRLDGSVAVKPDCPSPVRGRCECKPDGSWRPSPGTRKADDLALSVRWVTYQDQRFAVADCYVYDAGTAYWVCFRPHQAALERLRRQSMRRFLVLSRLLDGDGVMEAWNGLGNPDDLVAAALGICRDVEAWADREAHAEYERPPILYPKPRETAWTQKSESQQNAETAA